MGPIAIRRLAVAAAAVPAACGLVATALYFLGGGEIWCNSYDAVIFTLGFPGNLVTHMVPVPEAFEGSPVWLREIWDPALVNFVVLWGPIAGLLWLWSRAAPAQADTAERFWNQYTLSAAGLLY